MRTYIRTERPQRQRPTIRLTARPIATRPEIVRAERTIPARLLPTRPIATPEIGALAVDPYLDYLRALTAEGGIKLTYKDLDPRWRHTIWRIFAWTAATGLEAWYLFSLPPLAHPWITWLCLAAVAIINWLIVRKPVEVYRTIEVRPDCIILEGVDLFWSRFMENGWPRFQPDAEGNLVLCGVYGTRFVEFLTVRRFDEFDRAPEVLAAHLQDAMQQLWTKFY